MRPSRSRRQRFRLGPVDPVPVLFGGLREAGSGGGEVLRSHHGPEGYLGIECQEPRFGDCGDLRRIFHVEDDGGGAVAVVVGEEVGRFRLEVGEDAIDGGTESEGFDVGRCRTPWGWIREAACAWVFLLLWGGLLVAGHGLISQ